MDVRRGRVFAGIGRSTLLKLILPSSLTRTKKRRAVLWACESEPLGGVIGGSGLGSGRFIIGSGAGFAVSGLDRRSMLIDFWLFTLARLGKMRLTISWFSTRMISIRRIEMMSASRILILFSLDFSEVFDLLVFREVRAVLLDFRDSIGALLMAYYMHFPGYLANGIEPVSHENGCFETLLEDYEY